MVVLLLLLDAPGCDGWAEEYGTVRVVRELFVCGHFEHAWEVRLTIALVHVCCRLLVFSHQISLQYRFNRLLLILANW